MIYADFNGCCAFSDDEEHEYLDLCGYGTIGSLSHHQVRLKEDLVLKFYDPGDIEVEAVIVFKPEETDQHNPNGKWFAKYKKGAIRENKQMDYSFPVHVCFDCRISLEDHFEKVGRQYRELCPECGTSIMYPIAPPEESRS